MNNYKTIRLTGVFDKTGREIREWDVLKNPDNLFIDGVVEFVDGKFGVFLQYDCIFEDLKNVGVENLEILSHEQETK